LPNNGTIVAHAPCRVDLAGGTLDIWPLYLFHLQPDAVTVNFAVTIFTHCRVSALPGKQIRLKSVDTKREEQFASLEELCATGKCKHALAAQVVRFFAPDGGFEMETNSEAPAGAGISGSSALIIASIAAMARFTGRKLNREEMLVVAQNVEAQLIRVPTGCQDYYPAVYGGLSAVHLRVDGVRREAIAVPPEELDQRFILAYTGVPRQSGINNWEVFQAHIRGDRHVFHNFERIAEIARAMHAALARADWDNVARLMREEWKLRKANSPRITTRVIEKLVAVALRNGARAAKVCGAGGGGCVVFLTDPEDRDRAVAAIRSYGGQVLPAEVARDGLTLSGRMVPS
jgi:D-glycero-alpha-D-manno-heptose-7-phosphate kinase